MFVMPAPVLVVTGPVGAGKTTVGRLVARAFDLSVHLRVDDFMGSVVNGWVDPSLPEAAHQSDVLGAAVASAAMRCALGGYTVVLDGHFFPENVEGMAPIFKARSVPLHYAVLRTDLETCMARAAERGFDTGYFSFDADAVARLHARFDDLGPREAHVVGASAGPDEVAAAVMAAFHEGRLAVAR